MNHNHSQAHIASVRSVKEHMPQDASLYELSDLFQIFSDSTRISILFALSQSALCVGAISEAIGMEQSAVSHQLKVLRTANLVTSRREGKTNVYSLADDHVLSILEIGMAHLKEEA